MWLDLLLILLVVLPLLPLSRTRCHSLGNAPVAKCETRPTAWPVSR
jgi:hypothetical protein